MRTTDNSGPGKARWRARLTEGRAAVSAQQQVTEANALAEAVARLASGTVCCYVPFGPEPGSIALLDVLRDGGARVLLPVIPTERGPLDWADYEGMPTLVPGWYKGILEPGGPRLGPEGVAQADRVLVPALGVDHRGVRLGRGAGYYDRSLAFASPEAELTAVIRDTEFVERLPAEEHDVRMSSVLTPGRGLLSLPYSEPGVTRG